MADHRWSLLCRRGIIDKYTNTLSLIEVIDEVEGAFAEPMPEQVGVGLDCHLVTVWTRSQKEKPERFWQTITITAPTGETYPTEVKLEGNLEKHQRTRLLAGISAIRFSGPGTYVFKIYHSRSEKSRGKLVSQVPLEIKINSPSSTESEQPSEQF